MKKILMKLKYVIPILSLTLLLFSPLVVRAEDVGLPSSYENYEYWVIIQSSGGRYEFYAGDRPFYYWVGNDSTCYLSCASDPYYLSLFDGAWSAFDVRDMSSGTNLLDEDLNLVDFIVSNNSVSSFISSNHDIYSMTYNTTRSAFILDEVFFKAPLILAKTAEQLIQPIQTQAQIITTVAVGCLALLVGLTILAKKLRIFLPL